MRLCIVALAAATGLTAAQPGDEVKKVPLDSVYATTGQKDVKRISTAMDGGKYVDPAGAELVKLMRDLKQGGIALVEGKDVAAAVGASAGLFGRGMAQEKLTVPKDAQVWAAVYFGTNGSGPPAYQVKQIDLKGRTLRIGYAKQPAVTADVHQYLAWIPIGKASAGEYTLELYDVAGKVAAVKRTVTVAVK